MGRITQHIRLVLISSSLVFHGCEQPGATDPSCEKRPPNNPGNQPANDAVPSACGPVRSYHSTGGSHFWFWGGSSGRYGGAGSNVGTGSSVGGVSNSLSGGGRSVGGKSGAVSSGRGGFGSSAHGASS